MTVTVDLPDAVGTELKQAWGDELSRKVQESLLIEAYRKGLISRGRIGELLGLNFTARESFLRERGVPYNYDLVDFEQDLETARALRPTNTLGVLGEAASRGVIRFEEQLNHLMQAGFYVSAELAQTLAARFSPLVADEE